MAKLQTFWDYIFSREKNSSKLFFQGPLTEWEYVVIRTYD